MNKVLKAWWFGQLACALAAESLAQGQIFIGNRILLDGIDAPVFDSDCVTRLEGTGYLLQAYIGFTPDSLKPLGPVVSFRTGQYAGYIATYALDVPGTSSTLVYAQLRAWEAKAGTSYEAAVAAGGKYGFSNIVPVWTEEPPSPQNTLVGLQSFCLIPEPAPGGLLALGGGVWLLAARRRAESNHHRVARSGGGRPAGKGE